MEIKVLNSKFLILNKTYLVDYLVEKKVDQILNSRVNYSK